MEVWKSIRFFKLWNRQLSVLIAKVILGNRGIICVHGGMSLGAWIGFSVSPFIRRTFLCWNSQQEHFCINQLLWFHYIVGYLLATTVPPQIRWWTLFLLGKVMFSKPYGCLHETTWISFRLYKIDVGVHNICEQNIEYSLCALIM